MDFEKVDTFQKSRAERTYNNIHEGLKNVELYKVLGASGVFGYGLGTRKINTLLLDIPDIFKLYKKMSHKAFLARVLQVEGFAEKTAKQVVNSISYAEAFYIAMSEYTTFKEDSRSSDSLKGKQFVMSGFRDLKMENSIIDRGGKMISSVSKKTTGLIVANKEGKPTGKYKKALDSNVQVYTKEEFIKKFLED
jgi:NAD-dependent DNA ligase